MLCSQMKIRFDCSLICLYELGNVCLFILLSTHIFFNHKEDHQNIFYCNFSYETDESLRNKDDCQQFITNLIESIAILCMLNIVLGHLMIPQLRPLPFSDSPSSHTFLRKNMLLGSICCCAGLCVSEKMFRFLN